MERSARQRPSDGERGDLSATAEMIGTIHAADHAPFAQEWNERRRGHIAGLHKRVAEAEAKLKRLYEAIENGVINAADPSLKDRIAELSAIRDQAHADAERRLRRSNVWGRPLRPKAFAGSR